MSRFPLTLAFASALLLGVPAVRAPSAHAFEWLGRIAIDADELASQDPQTRLKAVRSLARYDIEWTREHLLAALEDPDVHVRSAAGRALAKNGEEAALPILIKWLALPDAQSKQIGAQILGEMRAQAAVPALVRALGDSDPLVRSASCTALGQIGGEAVIVPLVTRLEDDKSDVRLVAVQQLKELGDKRAVIPLVGRFRDSSQNVRIAAIDAVGSLGDASASAALVRELSGRDDAVKLAAIAALGGLEAKEGLTELIAVMARGNTAMRSKAAFSLAQIAKAHPNDPLSSEAVALLVEALAESALRNAAREALRTAGTIAVPHLIAHLDGARQGHPESAVTLLEEIGDTAATPALIRELTRGRVPQELTLRALSSLGDSRAVLPILALLESPLPALRLQAMQSLGPLLDEQSPAADILADRLSDEDTEIRLLAARFLGRMKARSAVENLIAIAKREGDFRLRANALAALGRIGDSRATNVALEALESETPALRAVGADVLSELADPVSLRPLLELAKKPQHEAQIFAIEVIGSVLRGKSNRGVASTLLRHARGPHRAQALAAIEAISGMQDPRIGPALVQLLVATDLGRQAAAAHALGELGHDEAVSELIKTLESSPARIGASAALSLGKLGDPSALEPLLRASQRRGTARAVNASAALAMLASAKNAEAIAPLLLHSSALVRVNAIVAVTRGGHAQTSKSLESMLRDDPSWLVRVAAANGLRTLSQGSEALERASKEDDRREVRAAAKAALQAESASTASTRWAVFRVVDPIRDDRPVANEEHFFIRSDGIAVVHVSDERGRMYSQSFPEGDFVHDALSSLAGY